MSEVVIRRPLGARIFTAAFGLVWTAGLVTVSVVTIIDDAALMVRFVPASMATFGGILFWRQLTASVRARARGVRVRNVLRTIDVPWSEVADVRMVQAGGEGRDAVRLILRNGRSVPIDVLDGDSESGSLRGRRLQEAFVRLRDARPYRA